MPTFTFTEELVVIPAGSFACICDGCGWVVYFVEGEHGTTPVEITADGDHHHPRIDQDGAGRRHDPHCRAGRHV